MAEKVTTLLRICLICILLLSTAAVRSQDSLFIDAADAMLSPGAVTHLEIDGQREGYWELMKDISLFTDLEVVVVRQVQDGRFPGNFFSDLAVNSLVFEYCDQLRLYAIFREIMYSEITVLAFRSCELGTLPVDMLPQSLEQLEVSGCPGVRFSGRAQHPKLSRIDVSGNRLATFPDFIAQVDALEEIDIRDNRITAVPQDISSLISVRHIDLRMNMIRDPLGEIVSLADSPVEFLALDLSGDTSGLSAIIADPGMNMTLVLGNDTLIQREHAVDDSFPGFAVLRITGEQITVLSDAYLHYEEIMENERFNYRFDSLLYDERYSRSQYANGLVVNLLSWQSPIRIQVPWFAIGRGFEIRLSHNERSKAFYRAYPEFSAFRRVRWRYDGDLTATDFRQKYTKGVQWLDIRLIYDEAATAFAIELKSINGFEQVPVVPYVSGREVPRNYQPDMASLHLRYQKQRSKRIERFNRKLIRQKFQYERRLERRKETAWRQFAAMYFSPEEMEMTKEEWLKYYTDVKANEVEALRNAPAMTRQVLSALRFLGYSEISPESYNRTFGDTLRKVIRLMDGQNPLTPNAFLVIDERNDVVLINGSGGFMLDNLLFLPAGEVLIYAELRNGDIALARWNTEEAARITSVVPLQVEIIKSNLHSVGQLLDAYEL